MTAQASTFPPTAWHPLPCGGRALRPGAEMVRHWDHVPEKRPTKAGRTGKREHEARNELGPLVGGFHEANTAERVSQAIKRGGAKGASVQSERAERKIRDALADDPTLQRLGRRTLVTGEIERPTPGSSPMLRVRCDCGAEALVQAGSWISRASNVGGSCSACAHKSGAARKGAGKYA